MQLVDLVDGQAKDRRVQHDVGHAIGADVEDIGVDARSRHGSIPVFVDRRALEYGSDRDCDPPGTVHGPQYAVSPFHETGGKEAVVHGQHTPFDQGKTSEENELPGKHVLW